MKIAENIQILEISGSNGTLYPVLLWDDNEVVLIDTGLPGQSELIIDAMSKVGFSPLQITKIILTHQDLDHIGGAKQLSQSGAEIMAYQDEVPFIQGDRPLVKIAELEKRLDTLSENERAFYDRLKLGFPNIAVTVAHQLKDGEVLPFCGGMKIIHTPGHTPGHISLYLQKNNILIAGDAANIKDGELIGANPQFTYDIELANKSFEKLMGHNAAKIVCYHGGII